MRTLGSVFIFDMIDMINMIWRASVPTSRWSAAMEGECPHEPPSAVRKDGFRFHDGSMFSPEGLPRDRRLSKMMFPSTKKAPPSIHSRLLTGRKERERLQSTPN
jgi:hypothetical protein